MDRPGKTTKAAAGSPHKTDARDDSTASSNPSRNISPTILQSHPRTSSLSSNSGVQAAASGAGSGHVYGSAMQLGLGVGMGRTTRTKSNDRDGFTGSSPANSLSSTPSPPPMMQQPQNSGNALLFWKRSRSQDAGSGERPSNMASFEMDALNALSPTLSVNSTTSTSSKETGLFGRKKQSRKNTADSIQEGEVINLDLTGFSFDPSFVPLDVVNPGVASTQMNVISHPSPADKNEGAQIPVSGSNTVTTSVTTGATSTWTPPESWGVRWEPDEPTDSPVPQDGVEIPTHDSTAQQLASLGQYSLALQSKQSSGTSLKTQSAAAGRKLTEHSGGVSGITTSPSGHTTRGATNTSLDIVPYVLTNTPLATSSSVITKTRKQSISVDAMSNFQRKMSDGGFYFTEGPTGKVLRTMLESMYDVELVAAFDNWRRHEGNIEERSNYIRVFREDHATFTTIQCKLNTNTTELMTLVGKKFFIPDLGKYALAVIRNGTERILGPAEFPLILQKRWLEQVGYTSLDKIEIQGREDNSYLCRFVLKQLLAGPEIDPMYWAIQPDPSRIELCNFNISTIPIHLFNNAHNILSLDLSRNPSISDLPLDFAQLLVNIKSLTLASNEIVKCPKSLKHVASLTRLDLRYNRIRDLSEASLGSLQNLEELLLDGNLIEKLPIDLCRDANQLKVLKLSNNRIAEWPMELSILFNTDAPGSEQSSVSGISQCLVDLDLSFNRIVGPIPEAISHLTRLRYLKLVGNRINGDLPRGLRACQDLREFNARANAISGGLLNLFACEKLHTVLLDGNCLDLTVTVDCTLKRLAVLSLSHQVPQRMSNVISLTPLTCGLRLMNQSRTLSELDLSFCGLSDLPRRFFEKLHGLRVLRLTGNNLRTLPPIVQNVIMSSTDRSIVHEMIVGADLLEELHVGMNCLETLGEEIGLLSNLQVLNVSRNRLRELPQSIWNLASLTKLNATCNLITKFPLPSNQQSSSLDNSISSNVPIPISSPMSPNPSYLSLASQSMFQMNHRPSMPLSKSLRELYLADNQIADDIATALHLLPKLRKLNLCFNELSDISQWLVQQPHAFNTMSLGQSPPSWTANRLSAMSLDNGTLNRGQYWFAELEELYLSGNNISFLPNEIEKCERLRWLIMSGNKLGGVPGEVSRLHNLVALDLGAQVGGRGEGTGLRYNVANVPYDWNWSWNVALRYLNLSGNKRLEIKPVTQSVYPIHGSINGGLLLSSNGAGSRSNMLPNTSSTNVFNPFLQGLTQSSIIQDSSSTRTGGIVSALSARPRTTSSSSLGDIPEIVGASGVEETESPKTFLAGRRSLTDFETLDKLQMLGLMDVTCLVSLPDESLDRRVRTTGSEVALSGIPNGMIRYAVADSLGRDFLHPSANDYLGSVEELGKTHLMGERDTKVDFLGVWDLVVPRFRGRDNEALFGIFDGRGTLGGNQVAKYCFDWFSWYFQNELKAIETERERKSSTSSIQSPNVSSNITTDANAVTSALRRTFLTINKELGNIFLLHNERKRSRNASAPPRAPMDFGCSALVLYFCGEMDPSQKQNKCCVYVANVGDGVAIVSKPGGVANVISQTHELSSHLFKFDQQDMFKQNSAQSTPSQSASIAQETSRESEFERMQKAGAWVDSSSIDAYGKIGVSRGFGFFDHLGGESANPEIRRIELDMNIVGSSDRRSRDASDEFIVLANGAVWKAFTNGSMCQYESSGQTVIDIVRSALNGVSLMVLDSPVSIESTSTKASSSSNAVISYTNLRSKGTPACWSLAALKVRDVAMSMDRNRHRAPNLHRLSSFEQAISSSPASPVSPSKHQNGNSYEDNVTAIPATGYMVMVLGLKELARKTQWWTIRRCRGYSEMTPTNVVVLQQQNSQTEVLPVSSPAMPIGIFNAARERASSSSEQSVSPGFGDANKIPSAMPVSLPPTTSTQETSTTVSAVAETRPAATDARLHKEIEPPVGKVALVFTDIKNSTALWESNPLAMRHAIKLHHAALRKLIRTCGGYEVKTEGDAFMVAFHDVFGALEWCLMAQCELLKIDWPAEILSCPDAKPIYWRYKDAVHSGSSLTRQEAAENRRPENGVVYESWNDDKFVYSLQPYVEATAADVATAEPNDVVPETPKRDNVLFRGLWVRMGVHFGSPLCEIDPITSRMDYYGPMVNRSARVCSASQGGQILVSSDVIREVSRKIGDTVSFDSGNDVTLVQHEQRDESVNRLQKFGMRVWKVGEVRLKGLETPEVLYEVYPRDLAPRRRFFQTQQSALHLVEQTPPTPVFLGTNASDVGTASDNLNSPSATPPLL